MYFVPFVNKYLSKIYENVRLNLIHMYKSYDYHKMFVYLSTPTFCEAVKIKHIFILVYYKKCERDENHLKLLKNIKDEVNFRDR